MVMNNKKIFLLILLFGTLIGFNESFIGNINMPYRSVILNSISLIILFIARLKINKPFSSIAILSIAVLFKLNNLGFYSCSSSVLLCGPTALLLLGISFEIFSFVFLKSNFNNLRVPTTLILTTLLTFILFGILNTYILNTWKISRFTEYITTKALLVGIISSLISNIIVYLNKSIKIKLFNAQKLPFNTILSIVIILFWVIGTFIEF